MLKMELFAATLCVCLLVSVSATNLHHHHDEDGEHDDGYDHDAVLGTQEEGVRFAKMSAEEAKRLLGDIFDKMDANRDSFVTRDEIVHWVMHSFLTLRREETLRRMKDHDPDNNGLVTWAEFLLAEHDYTPRQLEAEMKAATSASRRRDFEIIKHAADKFLEADHNSDKALDREEYHAMIYPIDSTVDHDKEVTETLKKYDTDDDGYITFKEYRGTDNATKDEETHMYDEFHHDYDTNRDGKIDRAEIKDWVLPGDKPAAESEADHLVTETDVSGDRRLSKEEITNQHQLWVGSAATGHGEQMHDAGEL